MASQSADSHSIATGATHTSPSLIARQSIPGPPPVADPIPRVDDVPCNPEFELLLNAVLDIWKPNMAFISILDSQSVWTARRSEGDAPVTVSIWGRHPDEKSIPIPPRWTMLEASKVTPIPDLTFHSYPRLRGSLDWGNIGNQVRLKRA